MQLSRDDMLQAAEDLIRSEGPDVTMAAVAAASSVTKPSLYRSVGDRQALVVALAERFGDRVNAAGAADIEPDDDGLTRLRKVFRAYVRVVDEDRNVFEFISADVGGDDRIATALGIAEVSVAPLASTLRHAGIADADALAWSYAIVGAAQFATFRWLRDGGQSPQEVADQLADLLAPGVAAGIERSHHDRP